MGIDWEKMRPKKDADLNEIKKWVRQQNDFFSFGLENCRERLRSH